MSKNEGILKAQQLMQQNLSHGAQSPKLSKMLEVLLEHFSKYNSFYLGCSLFLIAPYNNSVQVEICILKDIICKLLFLAAFSGQKIQVRNED